MGNQNPANRGCDDNVDMHAFEFVREQSSYLFRIPGILQYQGTLKVLAAMESGS